MSAIQVSNISKSYPVDSKRGSGRLSVLRNISVELDGKSILCLFGPNGSGKTTLINICAGLLEPDEGKVTIQGKEPKNCRIGLIPQFFAESLFPWRTNLENITFPLEIDGMTKSKRKEAALEFINKLDMNIPLQNYPYESSGGQKQLTALARALIISPEILFADEPFSALDYAAREEMQLKFLDITLNKTKTTTIFVSHDVDESVFMGDRVIVLGGNPTGIVDDIKVNLPRPRDLEIKKSKEFLETRSRVLDAFHKGLKARD